MERERQARRASQAARAQPARPALRVLRGRPAPGERQVPRHNRSEGHNWLEENYRHKGATGTKGVTGTKGATGAKGADRPARCGRADRHKGCDGSQGHNGRKGSDRNEGPTRAKGPTGARRGIPNPGRSTEPSGVTCSGSDRIEWLAPERRPYRAKGSTGTKAHLFHWLHERARLAFHVFGGGCAVGTLATNAFMSMFASRSSPTEAQFSCRSRSRARSSSSPSVGPGARWQDVERLLGPQHDVATALTCALATSSAALAARTSRIPPRSLRAT